MNVKPAPFALTPATVAALVGDRVGPRVVHVPVVSITLVDRPRRSEDPRLARANDTEILAGWRNGNAPLGGSDALAQESAPASSSNYAGSNPAPANHELLPPPVETIRSGEDGARGTVSGNLPVSEAVPHSFDGGAA